ncbi:MAG: carbonic anhydrase [Spirochaetales bacterium]|nr:carbonic anhydrase [Spirochaetales bacterium]
MDKLLQGIVHFRKDDFEKHRSLFSSLSREQKPHTLFIGCSDSRIVPGMMTKTLPGELFIIRNIANLVPPCSMSDDFVSTTAALEYAVKVLEVENIIVCGHSNCGGCASLYSENNSDVPHLARWMELAESVKTQVEKEAPENDPAAREWMCEQINVVQQMKHLVSYPYIAERFQAGKLEIRGWYYIIETGEVFGYDRNQECFSLLN